MSALLLAKEKIKAQMSQRDPLGKSTNEEYTRHPFLESRKMVKYLAEKVYQVNRKRIQRLYHLLGIDNENTTMPAHHEVHLESYTVKKRVENGWVEGNSAHCDPLRALYPDDVVHWIKASQPDVWYKLVRLNSSDAEKVVLDRLENR